MFCDVNKPWSIPISLPPVPIPNNIRCLGKATASAAHQELLNLELNHTSLYISLNQLINRNNNILLKHKSSKRPNNTHKHTSNYLIRYIKFKDAEIFNMNFTQIQQQKQTPSLQRIAQRQPRTLSLTEYTVLDEPTSVYHRVQDNFENHYHYRWPFHTHNVTIRTYADTTFTRKINRPHKMPLTHINRYTFVS